MTLPVSVDATWMNPSSVQYNAQELRRADSAMFNGDGTAFGVLGGVVRHGDASLAVTVNASDVVTVQPGAVVIPGNSGTGNGCYRTALGAADTGALTARNATLPRIDLVIFRVLDTDVVPGSPGYTGRVEILTGTAAASPVAPTLPALAVELGRISVPASSGGTATVDSSFRTYAVAPGGRLPVPTAARLPVVDSKYDKAIALDTGIEYEWSGTAWVASQTVTHLGSGNRLDATSTPQPSNPQGLRIVTGRVAATLDGSGATTLTFPANSFPNGLLSLILTTVSGTAVNPVINGGNATKTSASVVIGGGAGLAVVISYIAIGF